MSKELDEIGFPLCKAIQNGIKNESNYPIAYIEENGALSIQCVNDIKEFQDFSAVFSTLCEQHQIAKLSATETYSTWREYLNDAGKPTAEFTFNISPEDFDKLLIIESQAYCGYRNSQGAGSILLLADPLREAKKEGVICACPVLLLENNNIMLRTAGCNTAEIISTQLTYLITQYLPAEAYKNLSKRYGHWGAELTNCIMDGLSGELLVTAAMNCVGETNKHFYIQSMAGFDCLHLHEASTLWLQEMNPAAENIYRLLGTVTQTELTGLKSLEIPAATFLQALQAQINEHLKNYGPGGDRAPGGKYYYPENEKHDRQHCEKLQKNLVNINIILDQLTAVNTVAVTSQQTEFNFFQPNDIKDAPAQALTNSKSI